MTICLVGGALGIEADQMEIIRLAQTHGFESVEARPSELADLPSDEVPTVLEDTGLAWGTAGLPVDFRRDALRFEADLKALPALAKTLQLAGVTRLSTWLLPSHGELTYLQNFEQHAERLRRVAEILQDHDQRLGLEYVGTRNLLVRARYPFIHTLAETQELIARIGTGNVGLVLDSWHWWTAEDSVEEVEALKNGDVVLVDLNDAPAGVDKADQLDNRRQLPASTGVIPVKDFLAALVAIDYDGPVRAEPFNQTLNDLENEPACQATIQAMQRAFALLES